MCTSIGICDCPVKVRVIGIQSPHNILVLIGMATPKMKQLVLQIVYIYF